MTASNRDAARAATESDVHAPGVLGDVPPVSGARLARYAEAMCASGATHEYGWTPPTAVPHHPEARCRIAACFACQVAARAVVAVADAEQAEILARAESAEAEAEAWVEKANEAGKAYADANTKHHEELDRANRLEGMCERLAEQAVEYQDAQRRAESALTEARAEVERLTRWKSEATEVILGLQDLGRALELPLGERITGEAAAEAARTLKAEAERLRAAVTRAGEADQQTIHMYSAAMVRWNARAESSEAALASEREAHAGLRARLEALAGRWEADWEALLASGAEGHGHAARVGAAKRLRDALAAEPAEATASRPRRYDQCDDTCTTDCGHCKGTGRPAPVAAEEGDERR